MHHHHRGYSEQQQQLNGSRSQTLAPSQVYNQRVGSEIMDSTSAELFVDTETHQSHHYRTRTTIADRTTGADGQLALSSLPTRHFEASDRRLTNGAHPHPLSPPTTAASSRNRRANAEVPVVARASSTSAEVGRPRPPHPAIAVIQLSSRSTVDDKVLYQEPPVRGPRRGGRETVGTDRQRRPPPAPPPSTTSAITMNGVGWRRQVPV